MKCISCDTEINPKWKHAIDINVCPFCGKHIMEEHLKNCLVALASAMDNMAKYQDQLDDWMLSNHSYIKTNSPMLKSFLPKEAIKEMRREIDEEEFKERKQSIVKIKTPDGNEQEVIVEKIQSDEKAGGFFERAEALKKSDSTSGEIAPKSVQEKTKYLRETAERIKREGAAALEENNMASLISPNMLNNADPEAVIEYQQLMESGDLTTSSINSEYTGEEEKIPPVVLAMATRAAKKGGANEKDLQSLREMQNKVQNSQKRLGTGSFSRG